MYGSLYRTSDAQIKTHLNLNLENLANPEHTPHLHRECEGEQFIAARVMPKYVHITRVHYCYRHRKKKRHGAKDPGGNTGLGRQRLEIFHDAEPLADRVGDFLKDFRQVASRLSLNQNRRNADSQVYERDSRGQVFERQLKG